MRKVGVGVGLAVLLVLAGSSARAQGKGYGMSGCGLGSLVFGADQNTKMMQILAATTNNIIVPQTFAITSGTSNCVEAGVIKAEKEQAAFAEVNFQDLKRNMATGGGEYLTSFSTLLGCTDEAKPVFFKMTQEKYETILPNEKATPLSMLVSVKQQIKATPALASSCTDERAIARATAKAEPSKLALAKPVTSAKK
jgi:hypothetical protein